jgi:hypothetical protein
LCGGGGGDVMTYDPPLFFFFLSLYLLYGGYRVWREIMYLNRGKKEQRAKTKAKIVYYSYSLCVEIYSMM